jgi:hypothetical protein
MKEFRNVFLVFLLYLTLCHIFMYKALIPNSSIFGTDHQTQSQTFSKAMEIEIEKDKKVFPYWTSNILGGMPTAASFFTHKPQYIDSIWGYLSYPVFVVPGIVAKTFNLNSSDYNVIWWFSLFGLFMFLYLRKNGLSYFASFIGGLSFISCTGFISLFYPGHITGKSYVIGFMPLIMLLISYGFEKKRAFLFFALSGFLLARTMIFHIQIFFLLCVFLLLYVVLKTALDFYDNKDWKRVMKFSALCALLFLMPIALNADQLLPRMEFKKYTHRGAETPSVSGADKGVENARNADIEKYYFVTSFSQPPEDLLGLFMRYPFGMGKPYNGGLKEVEDIPYYRGRFDLRLSLEYVGIFVFLLSIIGFIRYRGQREVKLLLVLGIGSLLLSLGKHTILYDILYKMPGFKNFRIPLVYGMVSYVSFAALAGFGTNYIENFIRDREAGLFKKILSTLAVISGLLTVLALWGTFFQRESVEFLVQFELIREMLWGLYNDVFQRYAIFLFNLYYLVAALWFFVVFLFIIQKNKMPLKIAMLLLPLAISLDLWTLNNKFMIPIPQAQNVKEYMSDDNLVKFLKEDKTHFRIKSNVDEINNRWVLFGISNVEGYHPTPLKNFEETYSLMNYTNNIDNLFNIKYLVIGPGDQLKTMIENNQYLKGKYEKVFETMIPSTASKTDKSVMVYRNKQDYGRAFFVYNYGVVEQMDRTQAILGDPRYNPKEVALLNEKPKNILELKKGSYEKISFKKYTPNVIEMETENDSNALLVFSENWYPAWKAYVDGNKTEIIRAYGTLRAVFVPAGKHTVEFKFKSDTALFGEITFWIGFFSILGALGFEGYRIFNGRVKH